MQSLEPMLDDKWALHSSVSITTSFSAPKNDDHSFAHPGGRACINIWEGPFAALAGYPKKLEGVEDHVHLLMSLRTVQAPAELVRELKKASSVWAAQKGDPLFGWQEGCLIFSVSYTHSVALRRYIATQAEHHRKVPFLDELKRLLSRNGVPYDPQYLV